MTTTGWNCPNTITIDGSYTLVQDINQKQAWQNNDGIYLRWASMWNQWIFDYDKKDITSVAWKPADIASVVPDVGSFSDFRYGSTCGNNGVMVQSLVISETQCNEGNSFNIFSMAKR